MINEACIRRIMYEHADTRKRDPTTQYMFAHMDECIEQVRTWILYDSWVPSKAFHTTHVEPSNGKKRDIDYVPYWPDGVMHWVLIDTVFRELVPKMDYYCVAGIRGRGPHKTAKYVQRWKVTDPKGMKYGAELDIHHNFPESDHGFIKTGYRKFIKDKYWLSNADKIVDSFQNGLPIGYVTSHWFQNIAMTPFDRFMRSQPGVKHYYRYVDNIHLYGPNKRKLHRALDAAIQWLKDAHYTVNASWQVYRTDYIGDDGEHHGRAIDGVGFVVYCDHTILRKRTTRRLIRLCVRISKRENCTPSLRQARSAACRIGQLKHADMHHFRKKYVDDVIEYKQVRRIQRNASRRMCRETTAV